jgi:hypothetical protein
MGEGALMSVMNDIKYRDIVKDYARRLADTHIALDFFQWQCGENGGERVC